MIDRFGTIINLPFTIEQFFGIFRLYNNAVWPTQILLLLLALSSIIVIALRQPWSGVVVSAILAFLWFWIGAIYHLAFFTRISPAAFGFGVLSLAGGLLFVWQGVVRRRLSFACDGSRRSRLGLALILFALAIYPLWATLAGHGYPELPTFGLPCPTTIFTIGVLGFASGPGLRKVLTVPILWSLVGSQAAFLFDWKPDLGLLVAGAIAIGLFWSPRPCAVGALQLADEGIGSA